MKTVYLSKTPQKVRAVFGTEEPVYTKEDVCASPALFRDTEIIFSTWGMPAFTEEEVRAYFPALKAIFYGAGTVQSFARPFLNCGVRVFSARAANAVPVAEYTAAQIVLANKGFFRTMRFTDRASARELQKNYPGNYGAKVGIIGAGAIGKLLIGKLRELSLELLVFDPFLPEEQAAALGVRKCALETLFRECFTVSNHLADNGQTRGMLNRALFESMPPNAVFLNTGRGAQVVEEDLIAVLRARPDLTAILDVTHPEPPEPGSPFYTLPNCILTPHIAGSTGGEVRRMGDYITAEYEKFRRGEPCPSEVTAEMLQTMA